jgi:hypothetical protein
MYLFARSLSEADPRWWLVAGGAVLACSALVRHVSLALPLILALWAAAALPGRPRVRMAHGLTVLISATLVIGAYFVVSKPIAGGYSGLTENQGFSLYGRVGQFADCTKFTPPTGTAPLCVDTPPSQRAGPFFWTFGEQSPIRTNLQIDTYNSDHQQFLAGFGRAAILNQPLDYLRTVSHDFARYFAPGIGTPRPDSGSDAENMSFDSVVPTAQGASLEELADQFDDAYTGVGSGQASETARTLLGSYQSLFRVQGLLTLLLIALALAGAVVGRGKMRAGASLFLVAGLALLALPPLLSSYDVRYSVPPINLLSAGAAFGLAVIARRIAMRRDPLSA